MKVTKSNTLMNLPLIAATLLMGIYGISSANAALITWSAGFDIFNGTTSQNFVSTTGTFAAGLNAAGADVTVNEVSFQGADSNTVVTNGTGEGIRITGGNNNGSAFGDGEFSGDPAIESLLQSASFNIPSAGVELTGLTIGELYEIQVITHDSRTFGIDRVLGLGDGGAVNIATRLQLNVQNDDDGTGQSALGVFRADATTQSFQVFGSLDNGDNFGEANGAAQINAIQLRIVPEVKSLLVLLALGFAILFIRPKRSLT